MRKGIRKATKDYHGVKIQLIDHDKAGEYSSSGEQQTSPIYNNNVSCLALG